MNTNAGGNATDHGDSPLKPSELNVLRAQYEKEGEYVGLQTKFNYAWVGRPQNDSPWMI